MYRVLFLTSLETIDTSFVLQFSSRILFINGLACCYSVLRVISKTARHKLNAIAADKD